MRISKEEYMFVKRRSTVMKVGDQWNVMLVSFQVQDKAKMGKMWKMGDRKWWKQDRAKHVFDFDLFFVLDTIFGDRRRGDPTERNKKSSKQ